MKDIYRFKKGDFITKISPVIDPETGKKDYTLVGKKLEFRGIANASIYIKRDAEAILSLFLGSSNYIIQLPLEIWVNGWDYYIDPEFLEEDGQESSLPKSSKETDIENQIAKAIEREDFEKASELKAKLKKLRRLK